MSCERTFLKCVPRNGDRLKKIDLHIHTVKTFSDSDFTFSLENFKRYVSEAKLDAVAVTNHDYFDSAQFLQIQNALPTTVFPGIEINVEKGHLLVIARPTDIDDFAFKTAVVAQRITKIGERISVDELIDIFGDLSEYLLIPHYDKGPAIAGDTLEKLRPYVSAGEVDSTKKFVRNWKDSNKLTPVLFSDSRMMDGVVSLPTRQTFVDCGALTIEALKNCLLDKSKVTLTEYDGNQLWQVFDNGQMLSTGLNVLIGARSTGKTHTLNKISKAVSGCKYIRQFSLVQQEDASYERDFMSDIERRRSAIVDDHLASLKRVIDDVAKVNLVGNDRKVGEYLATLLKSAAEADRSDAYSNAALFNEVEFEVPETKILSSLFGAVQHIIENLEYRAVIEKHLELAALKRLACELIELLRAKHLGGRKKTQVNELVKEIKKGLAVRSATVQIQDVDLYASAMDKQRVARFSEVIDLLKIEKVVFEESVSGFRVEARRQPFGGAGELKTVSGKRLSFADAYKRYSRPFDYLQELIAMDVPSADYYKLFVKINYRILNKDGHEVSGGERSEFRLLQEIADAQSHELLLIDEPESSFDNMFLKSEVNQLLKAMSQTMPIVVVTHNNTVGASIGADYLLFATKDVSSGAPAYRLFSGYPTDKTLKCVDGAAIKSHKTLLDSLEAGEDAYQTRSRAYEAVKDS
jgi:hypothetical protein